MKQPFRSLKVLLPLVVLLMAGVASWMVFALRTQPAAQSSTAVIPEVNMLRVQPQTLRLNVQSQGVVTPREEIDLVSEVAGKVVQMHPALVAGGFFKANDLLLTIDPRDYDYAITSAQAKIAEAKRVLISEQAQVEQALHEWQALGEGEASELVLRKPQLAEAQAKLLAAQADLAKAQLNHSRCELRAPFTGRVLSKQAGVGQFITVGAVVARIYASDVVEIRLPISTEQLGFLNLPLVLSPPDARQEAKVSVTADLGGHSYQWLGHIVRSEAAVSEDSGQWYWVAQVLNPVLPVAQRPPLLKGLFVHAEIEGTERTHVYRLPRNVVSSMQTVKLVNAEQKLEIRTVQVLRSDSEAVIVESGLNPGERVVVSELPMAINGTAVKVLND